MNYEKMAVQAVIAFRRNLIMNKTELVAAVAEQAGLSKKDAEAAVKAFTDVVAEALKAGDKIQLVGFGTFEDDSSCQED